MRVPFHCLFFIQIFSDDEFSHFNMRTIAHNKSPTLAAVAREARPLFKQNSRRFFRQAIFGKTNPLETVVAVGDDLVHGGGQGGLTHAETSYNPSAGVTK